MTAPDTETLQKLLGEHVKPLKWSRWGGEWDTITKFGALTVKLHGHSGYYLFKGNDRLLDCLSAEHDSSTPEDSMKQANNYVLKRVAETVPLTLATEVIALRKQLADEQRAHERSVAAYGELTMERDRLAKAADALKRDVWMPHDTAPRDGRMFLIRYPRMMNLVCRIWFDTVHGYFKDDNRTDGGITNPVFLHDGDLWAEIPAYREARK
ncbi:hypothetical protein AN189_17495 [Loktanella sp. 3ANDIMAR09]|uniref:hypothetical protein n=1 Tax=Loktanella sp. 3ANDIMAR09 TaxID=1225657 RepID=UPI0006F37607|nr:hypothetical protein [Loktanella sp. 3ANDIMAR09]KQI67020.1 hypothetical protein AN189_17495 [Loktanella sp. 3ANDIMAR09]